MNKEEEYARKYSKLKSAYYSFKNYNSKTRLITYWHQIDEVLDSAPQRVLEIGKGTGLVSSYLKNLGVEVATLDINEELQPDFVGDVTELDQKFDASSWDVVLCARVLHHIPFAEFENIISQCIHVARSRAVISVPVDDFRIYFSSRVTSRPYKTITIPLPLFLKKRLGKLAGKTPGSGLWQVNSSKQTAFAEIERIADAQNARWRV